ncbi:TetR/AcrR family transcriptional regulator [Weissella hellenica]|uniref:TetR family transcriptional regulator n=1 Tax=Weissella hellenica TaxID=46256 RepID=A0A4Y4G6J5_WEIHE|nr:TetR/AcrR family transcriptional regulator C-terminal domain-containing protein [Weissella hellenica]NKY67407.1 TetR family transcriptional regulator [Weissella hellenica]GED36475.1 TetR family transcriptional regulator [Weissella hellenica]SCC07220.1 transcriptional regulator, TetR family [Weissella hellenica]
MKQADRNARTKQSIKQSFIKLIENKGFSNITVSDITRDADVSRSTFYVHYTDKYELLTKIEDELIMNITAALKNNLKEPLSNDYNTDRSAATYRVFSQALEYVDSERATMHALFSANGDSQFFSQVKNVVDNLFTTQLSKNNGYFVNDIPIDYTKEIAINSILNIVRHWLDKSNPESPDELANILMRSRFMAPHDLIAFN